MIGKQTPAKQSEANANMSTNSDIINATRSLQEGSATPSTDMMDALNGIKAHIVMHWRRIRETEERFAQAEEDITALQQKS